MTVVYSYEQPERFVAGTVGEPGQRTFFLQARSGPRLTSVALEKQQVTVLAERLDELLDQVMRDPTSGLVPAAAPAELIDNGPLDQPIQEEFRAGTMTLAWDPEIQRVAIEVFPIAEQDPAQEDPAQEADEPEYDEMLLVRLTAGAARAFAKRALSVVAAGRPPCPFCGGPLDASGHLCPRANGFRRTML
ncbi:MAG: DUF3090 domain-containing protein [Nocardioidaceae bacterium]